jgi:intraflagellar transport protein 122
MYSAGDGSLIKSIKVHQNSVYSVAWSTDGKHFASCGADKHVYLFGADGEPRVRYAHDDTVQRVLFNPVTSQLVSCSKPDFAMLAIDEEDVRKEVVRARGGGERVAVSRLLFPASFFCQ